MGYIDELGVRAKAAARQLGIIKQNKKNEALEMVAKALIDNMDYILEKNAIDVKVAEEKNTSPALIDRLALNKNRIEGMATGLLQIKDLNDPIGEVLSMQTRPNGLVIGQKRVPLGVIGIIFESRPNVTADAFGLCFKTGNAVILRGGSDAINSNIAIVNVIRDALKKADCNQDAIQLLENTDRKYALELMKANDYVDVLIPRGGAGLINTVVMNSTVPVIETGTGNCHIFVDESADIDMAIEIIDNAKTQRLGVCNAAESLVVHKNVSDEFYTKLAKVFKEKEVMVKADENAIKKSEYFVMAQDSDWGMEYLDKIISLKVVNNIDEAIEHINKYNTGHSESIITSDYSNAMKFHNEVDAAAVYVNASTRFTDGFEFGFGAEIGISTQKLHARGPMGLNALTTTKYIIFGSGQIRK